MKSFIILSLSGALVLLLSSCNKDDEFKMGGVPSWVAGGAKIESEPEPYRPDPAIAHYEDESGPVNFTLTPEKQNYKSAPAKKKSTKPAGDPLEKGRDYRIRRLVR